LPAHHDLDMVDYKALTGLSLLWVPHFCARRGASLKDLNLDTTPVSKGKCFPINRRNTTKHTNVGKPLELRGAIVIYQVGQITHRAITISKRDQVIVTMYDQSSRQNKNRTYKNYDSKPIKKGKDTRAHRSLRLLPELKRRLASQLLIGLHLRYYY
jgi:hypothetical protein